MTRKNLFTLLLVLAPSAAAAQTVRVVNDDAQSRFTILIGPIELPVMGEHHGAHGGILPPVETVSFPMTGYLTGFSYDVVDQDGKTVPNQVVHHLNFIDPDHRELFLPISRRVAAAGGETGDQAMPWFLFGLPVNKGDRLVVAAMLHNPTSTAYHGATVRFTMTYQKTGRPWPLFPIQPFQVDAAFPFGDKSWDLPPGASSRSWEGKPAVNGKILIMGGHLHEYATRLRFQDATTGKLIFDATPYMDDNGNVNSLTTSSFLKNLGMKVDTSHLYRVTVDYQNPKPDTMPSGGMGVVAGIFLPSSGEQWLATDVKEFLYVMDRKHYMREVTGTMAVIMAPPADKKKPAEHKH
ncbi:MAG: hypothetical protein EXR93_01075 [Gemmatimonadetes bacterium]|nr:hypothetical protein [Gemmatimonadota bacterium]